MKIDVKDIVMDLEKYMGEKIVIDGWVRNHRNKKNLVLLILVMELVLKLFNLFMIID